MEIQLRPIRAQDSVEDLPPDDQDENENGQGLNQGSQLDFESEFADFLGRNGPNNDNNLSDAGGNNRPCVTTDHLSNHRLEYNADGTINCCDINYGSLVRTSSRHNKFDQ